MDKYEYQLKTEHIRQVAARKEYSEAAKLCDTIDWTKIRDVKMLTLAADVYTAVGEYDKAIDILQQAYQYAAMGRRIVYRLTELALKAGSYEDAKNYFEEFCRIAPNDQGRYILLYKMARFKKATLEEKIQILEAYKKEDFDEKWAYELAVLYAMNDEKDKCIQLCDDIILWFGLGKYVEKALSLKSQFAVLTPAQKEKVQKFADKKAKEEEEKRQKELERKQKESNFAQKEEAQKKILKWQEEQEKAYQAEQDAAKEEAKAREEEQKAKLEREEKLRLEREKEKALKEEQEREDARKAAERLKEAKAREEQERLQQEQEEREAVERLKKAQRQEHARRSVVTSDMNEIMAVIQRAKQEDAQDELQETLAKQVKEVQKLNASDKLQENEQEVENIQETDAQETNVQETKDAQEDERKIEETNDHDFAKTDANTEYTSELTATVGVAAEDELETQAPEQIQYAQETASKPDGENEWFEKYQPEEEPQISEWEAPKAEEVTVAEAEEVAPDTEPVTFEEAKEPQVIEEVKTEEVRKEEPKSEVVEPETVETKEFEAVEESDAVEEPEQAEENEAVEADLKMQEASEEKPQEENPAEEAVEETTVDKPQEETWADAYDEQRRTKMVGNSNLPIVNPEDLSRVWHFAIQAMPGEDDIELALEYLQELAESSPRAVPQSVVKITGRKLNQKGLVQSLDKLLGKTILIENAAEMSDRVIDEFCKIIDPTDRSLLVVFIDTPASIRHLLLDHPQLAQAVTAQFVRERYSVTELLEYARGYADREDSVLDKSGELALMERLKVIAENQERNKKRIVEMIVNNAIEKAEKKSMRKLFQTKYDKKGCLILRDKDFEVN